MEDFNNENQNGVFGGFSFGENTNNTDNTSFFGEMGQNNNPEKATNEFNGQNAVKNEKFWEFGAQQVGNSNESVNNSAPVNNFVDFKPIERQKAVTKQGLWSKIRAFLFQEIDLTAPIRVELTPYQQKVENEINEFLHQEVSFKGIAKLFGKK